MGEPLRVDIEIHARGARAVGADHHGMWISWIDS